MQVTEHAENHSITASNEQVEAHRIISRAVRLEMVGQLRRLDQDGLSPDVIYLGEREDTNVPDIIPSTPLMP